MEFGIGKWAMVIIKSGKRQIAEGIELPIQEKIRMNRKPKVLGNIGSGHHQTSEDKRKNEYLRRMKKTFRNQTLQQESHQRDKYLGYPNCKILGTILKIDEVRIQKMDQRTRKLKTIHQALHPRDNTDYTCQEKNIKEDFPALKIA